MVHNRFPLGIDQIEAFLLNFTYFPNRVNPFYLLFSYCVLWFVPRRCLVVGLAVQLHLV